MNVTVIGNLCADPELRHTSAGVAVAELRIAENRSYQDASGRWRQETAFYPAVAWRRLADHAAASLHKGDRIVVVGRLRQEEWTTEKGETRRRSVIDADDIAASLRFTEITVNKTETEADAEPKEYAPDDPTRPFELPQKAKIDHRVGSAR